MRKKSQKKGQNLDYNSWMPEMQEGFTWNSHLQVYHKYGSTPWPRWTRNRWSETLGCVYSLLKGKFRNQLDKEFKDEDWLHCLYLGMIKTRFAICKMKNAELRCSRSIQGHSGGMVISPRLMNYVMIPYKYKQFFIMWVEHEINTPLQELN